MSFESNAVDFHRLIKTHRICLRWLVFRHHFLQFYLDTVIPRATQTTDISDILAVLGNKVTNIVFFKVCRT